MCKIKGWETKNYNLSREYDDAGCKIHMKNKPVCINKGQDKFVQNQINHLHQTQRKRNATVSFTSFCN